MKKTIIFLALALLLVASTSAWAASVTPVQYPNLQIGDAAFYCVSTLDYDFGIKIESWPNGGNGKDRVYDDKGSFVDEFVNEITIKNATRSSFDWESDPYAIGAVIVQGGPYDNIFFYAPAVISDEDLYPYNPTPPNDKSRKSTNISHVSFCWNKTDGNGGEVCYQDETAWAEGDRYQDPGNWAMYVPYDGEEKTVDLLAGQTILAGTVTFSAPEGDEVTITIQLAEGFIFYYDLYDIEEDDNLKVQDYEFAPSGNPAPGLFDHKYLIPFGSDIAEITVPLNNFYGVHVDLAYEVECE
jgi:hypothetical protein